MTEWLIDWLTWLWILLLCVTGDHGCSAASTPRWDGHPSLVPRPLRVFGIQRFRPSSLYTVLRLPVSKPVAWLHRRGAPLYLSCASERYPQHQQWNPIQHRRGRFSRLQFKHRLSDATEQSSWHAGDRPYALTDYELCSRELVSFTNRPTVTAPVVFIHLDLVLLWWLIRLAHHVSKTVSCCFNVLRQIRSVRRSVTRPVLQSLVVSLVSSRLDYSNATLAGLPGHELNRLQSG